MGFRRSRVQISPARPAEPLPSRTLTEYLPGARTSSYPPWRANSVRTVWATPVASSAVRLAPTADTRTTSTAPVEGAGRRQPTGSSPGRRRPSRPGLPGQGARVPQLLSRGAGGWGVRSKWRGRVVLKTFPMLVEGFFRFPGIRSYAERREESSTCWKRRRILGSRAAFPPGMRLALFRRREGDRPLGVCPSSLVVVQGAGEAGSKETRCNGPFSQSSSR